MEVFPNERRRYSANNHPEDDGDENEEEEGDTISPLCTCGQNSLDPSMPASNSSSSKTKKTPTWLESSFVHLMAPRRRKNAEISSIPIPHQQHGFLEQHQHMQQLIKAATATKTTKPSASDVDDGDDDDEEEEEISMCQECIDRVALALEADTQRLYAEVAAYQTAATESRQRSRTFEKTISRVNLNATEQTYEQEIGMLEQEVQAREAELAHLQALYQEQLDITQQLDSLEQQVQSEQNALELQAKSFDDSLHLTTKTLANIQSEVDQLTMVRLPQSLFDLQVDERGLRYPLINQLRLAYRPKGDVPLQEIQVAWSQATQLLLVLGTLLNFSSGGWKLVPLADCAKLIYHKEIYNLSPGDVRSLMAWNALLDQVVKHSKSLSGAANNNNNQKGVVHVPDPPFSSSSNSIGSTDLTRLDRMDHGGWSQVIHRMACNLKWLSDRACDIVAFQVGALAHSVA